MAEAANIQVTILTSARDFSIF